MIVVHPSPEDLSRVQGAFEIRLSARLVQDQTSDPLGDVIIGRVFAEIDVVQGEIEYVPEIFL